MALQANQRFVFGNLGANVRPRLHDGDRAGDGGETSRPTHRSGGGRGIHLAPTPTAPAGRRGYSHGVANAGAGVGLLKVLMLFRYAGRFFRWNGLAVGLVSAVLWWRSGRVVDVLIAPNSYGEHWLVTIESGVLVAEWQQLQPLPSGGIDPTWVFFTDPLPRRWPGDWRWLGFDLYKTPVRHFVVPPSAAGFGVVVPHWFLIVVGVWPAVRWFVVSRRRRIRRAAGSCLSCGYDLRASTGRCPECGAPIGDSPEDRRLKFSAAN